MTISDAMPPNWPSPADLLGEGGASPALLLGVSNSVDFVIGSYASPLEAIEKSRDLAAFTLPRLLGKATGARQQASDVLTELVDLTARYPASAGLLGRLEYDGSHVMVSVGDMGRTLPTPEEEPGLYLVNRVAADIGQYTGDRGGLVTWAAIST